MDLQFIGRFLRDICQREGWGDDLARARVYVLKLDVASTPTL